jgi:hypothetical protein
VTQGHIPNPTRLSPSGHTSQGGDEPNSSPGRKAPNARDSSGPSQREWVPPLLTNIHQPESDSRPHPQSYSALPKRTQVARGEPHSSPGPQSPTLGIVAPILLGSPQANTGRIGYGEPHSSPPGQQSPTLGTVAPTLLGSPQSEPRSHGVNLIVPRGHKPPTLGTVAPHNVSTTGTHRCCPSPTMRAEDHWVLGNRKEVN